MHFPWDKRGDVGTAGVVGGDVRSASELRSVAVTTLDDPGLRARALVGVGERVRAGDALMEDRRRPAIRFTAPVSGVVTAVRVGPRRRLEGIVLDRDGDEAVSFASADGDASSGSADGDASSGSADGVTSSGSTDGHVSSAGGGGSSDGDGLRRLLLESGLWTALRARPFGRVPDPEAAPAAILVTVRDTRPFAPDADVLVAARPDDFERGVLALAALTSGRVHVCVAPESRVPVPEHERVRRVEVRGPHPAGLPGTQVHRLEPVVLSREVWDVEAQDVLAVGALLTHGRLDGERVVAVAGPRVSTPCLVRAPSGASVAELVGDAASGRPARLVAGSVLDGRLATGSAAWLGRRHRQVTVLPELAARPDRTTGLVPWERQERAFPFDVPVTSLLRALEVGDVETAVELGVLELLEEDVAILSALSPSRLDHAAALRAVLDVAAKEGLDG